MDDCTFCKIVRKEIPATIITEDNTVLAFLDIHPVNLGHTLIIPKQHIPYMTDAPDDILSTLYIAAKKLMPVLKESLGAKNVTLTVVGLDVSHFHIHLIPRFENDGLKDFWPTKTYASNEEKEKMGEKIKSLLS
ncbi:MAG: hypothetical protein JWL80_528 [Parcubacteria group bacterium]|nr:hypothetical protein [Parcubacteria group bacterium]